MQTIAYPDSLTSNCAQIGMTLMAVEDVRPDAKPETRHETLPEGR